MKWERPAWSCDSTRAPVPIQDPSATDLTEGIASVTTRAPELSSVRRCCCCFGLTVAVPIPRAPPAVAAVASAAVTVASAASATVAAPAPARRGDRRELLDGLAGDLRVVGEAQADAAALPVDL